MLVQNEGVQLSPITDSDNTDVNSNSSRLIQKSLQAYSQEKRLLQVIFANIILFKFYLKI
jgi:hypothetical protein